MPKRPGVTRRSTRAKAAARPPETVGAWLEHALAAYEQHGVALGQVAGSAHDEALYLLLRTLDLPLDSGPSVLKKTLTAAQQGKVRRVFDKRIRDHVPAAYLTREAFLGEHRFYVDERVIIPRSYFLEIIPGELDRWLADPSRVRRVVDVCTGSGCLAILLAHHFPKAAVDAIDLSPDALEVAKINLAAHQLEGRVELHQSDVFDAVPPRSYDVILSNPPYEPTSHVDAMPEEFHREPRMSLDGGADGLDIIRRLLLQARERLQPDGIVLIEVGGLQPVMNREFSALQPKWLRTADGSNCVCVISERRLRTWRPDGQAKPRRRGAST